MYDLSSERKKFHFDNIYYENPRLFEDILLYQIGDLSCEGGYTTGKHDQICYEISFVVSGRGRVVIDGTTYDVEKGDIFINQQTGTHECVADRADPFRYFYVGFRFEEHEDDGRPHPLDHVRKMFESIRTPVMRDRFHIDVPFVSIFNELINAGDYSAIMIKTYLQQIVVLAYRNFFESWDREYKPVSGGADKTKQIVYDVINFIDTHLSEIEDLTAIGAALGYSYAYISRVFTQETGLSVQEYYNKKRFEKALALLREGGRSITAIAEELGYQSIHSFSKAFRKNFGISPSEYLQLNIKD